MSNKPTRLRPEQGGTLWPGEYGPDETTRAAMRAHGEVAAMQLPPDVAARFRVVQKANDLPKIGDRFLYAGRDVGTLFARPVVGCVVHLIPWLFRLKWVDEDGRYFEFHYEVWRGPNIYALEPK